MSKPDHSETAAPAVGSQLDGEVGRPVAEARPLATFGPCCRILRIGVHPPSVMHDGGCRDRHDGELGPTLLLYGQADIDAAMAAERERCRWRPIETAPCCERVMLWWRHAGPRIGRIVSDETGEGWRTDGDECVPRNQHDCTHWMPLPDAPNCELTGD